MRILSWNLFHGRAVPPAGRDLTVAFAALLAGWEWDVALLQEVPPWWPRQLAAAAAAEQRAALTSRNSLQPVRRWLAERRPDLLKSNGGGCNAILSRRAIVEYHTLPLRAWPERRIAQLASLGDGTRVVNFHGSARVALAQDELERLWNHALWWAGDDPLILGGDLNLRDPQPPRAGVAHIASRDVDHVFVRGLDRSGDAELLDRHVTIGGRPIELSDHVPLLAHARRAESTAEPRT